MNYKRGGIAGILIMAWAACVGPARGDDVPAIAVGFQPHVLNQKGGGIDWTSGEIIAEGVGKVRGSKAGDRLGAERGATLLAARNALAIANGIQIDASGRVGNMRNGQIKLDGVVKGQRVVATTWDNTKKPVECHVKLRVPMWGMTGVCTVFTDAQRRMAVQRGGKRLVLVDTKADVRDAVLVIDARGRKIEMCLFPTVVSADGGVLYDVATRTDPQTKTQPPVRFVETDITFEKLQSCLERPAGWAGDETRVVLANQNPLRGSGLIHEVRFSAPIEMIAATAFAMDDPAPQPTTQGATSQPTSRPGRRRVVVKAADLTPGKTQSQIVLTKEDAEKLRQSPEGANLLRDGKVIVVVDSAAAGMQGFLSLDGDDTSLASSAR
jgi:hypothetical protein